MPALALENLSVHYGKQQVIGPVTLHLNTDQLTVFIGKSGGGKSSLLNHIYDRLSSNRSIALIPQDLGLVDTLSAYQNVYMGQLYRHSTLYNLTNLIRPRQTDIAAVHEQLKQLDLADKCWQPVGELSGGQQQRIAIARALYQQADLLIADEPCSALDGPRANQAMQLLRQQYPGAIIALHDLDVALKYADRIIGIADGQIALDQPTARLTHQSLLDFY
ncbi:ATP-binding cassette domain-containing protein [Aliamphritea spongicola]|uniref:ATP-binding cassette domain-containing protein n=1 Tax=Aliamphritea spongicola TaxID=707589 RepID=UPI00196B414D|nr:ATP-binding cassette domain-containing protein [Aliamphritea spongicola]MBN3561381.1 ATP-binding cassette domain-containing protein [Aliamphritea spongicola]